MAEGAKKARIAQAYVQLIPVLSNDFKKQLQAMLNNAIKSLDFSALTNEFRQAGRDAGRAFRRALDSAIGNGGPDLNYRDMITEAGQGGRNAGREIRRSVDAALGNYSPDLGTETMKQEAGQDAKEAGREIVATIKSTMQQTTFTLPPIQGAAAAGAAAGQQAGQAAQSQLQQYLSGVGDNILGAVGVGAAAAVAGKGIGHAITVDTGAKEIQASLHLSDEENEKVKKTIRELFNGAYAETHEAAEEVVEGLLAANPELINASQAEIQKQAAAALALNQAYEVPIDRVVEVSSQMVKNGFATDMDNALDLMGAAFAEVPIPMREELIQNLDEYSKHMANLGLTGEAAIGLISAAASKGGAFGLDQFTDAIKESGILLSNVSDTGVGETLDKIGLKHSEIAADILAGGERADKALEKVALGLLGMEDPTEQAAAAISLFGTPLEELGVQHIPEFLSKLTLAGDYMGDIEGKADSLSAVMRDNFKTRLTSLGNTALTVFSEIFIPLLEKAIPPLEKMLHWITENETAFQWIAGSALVVATALSILIGVGFIGWAVAGVAALGPLIAATWAWTTALLANPLTWIVLGIAALIAGIVLLVVHFETVKDWILDVWGTFSDFAQDTANNVQSFSDMLEGFVVRQVNAIIGIINGIARAWNQMVDDLAKKEIKDPFGKSYGTWESVFGSPNRMAELSYFPLPQMATGGDVVGATALIAGEKDPETITNRGKTNRMIDGINRRLDQESTGNNRPIYITVNPSADMDEARLADRLVERLSWETGRV